MLHKLLLLLNLFSIPSYLHHQIYIFSSTGALSGLTDGLFFSWSSPFLTEIIENKENYDISAKEASLFNSIYPIGMIIGSPIFSVLSDKIGRKRTYLLTVIPQISSWLFAAFAKNVYYFYVSRILAGFSMACFFAVLPTYIGEIANPNVRGTWGNVLATSIYVGELMINIIGICFNVKQASFVCLIFPIIFVILFSMMPETPHYYIMRKREEEAKKSLRFLTRKQNVDEQYKLLASGVNRQISESGTWIDLIKIKSNRRAIAAGAFLRFSQYTSGYAMFLQYIQVILQKSGSDISSQLSGIIFMTFNVSLNVFVNLFIVDRFQRKTLYATSLAGCGLTLYILGTYFYVDANYNVNLSYFNWVPITLMIIFLIFIALGIGCLPTLMMSELFSAKIKAKAMAILINVFALGLVSTNTLYYYIETCFGFHAPFYFFAICNTIALVISFYVIPETKGKSLEEIQLMLKGKKKLKPPSDAETQCKKY